MEFTSSQLVLVVMATALFCPVLTAAAKPRNSCRIGEEFFNLGTRTCVPCSPCTENTIPHRQCYGTKDTLCLPFGKFEFRQSVETETRIEPKRKSTQAAIQEREPEVSEQTEATLLFSDENSGEKWFTITLALAGILVVACLAVVILLLVSCYMCKKKQREVLYDPAFAGALLADDNSTQGKMQLFKIVTET